MRWAWLGLPLLTEVTATLANATIAAHIRQGLSIQAAISEGASAGSGTTPVTTPTTTSPDTSMSTHGIVTGSGSAFASSCQAALWSWKQASETYGSAHGMNTTTEISGSVYATYTYTNFTGGVKASRLTTLCDGYPRAIGSASYDEVTSTTISFTPYSRSTSVPGTFTTPMPCSIGPSDCSALWKSFASSTSASLVYENKSELEPPCQTEPSNSTIPFETAACTGPDHGSGLGVIGSQVRLLYWPVRTVDEVATDSYFCSTYVYPNVTPTYMPGTRTGNGPNTFVTGDLTITSPTVAISFSGLHRLDGCGPTVDHTILTMDDSKVSSVRGVRAAFAWYPFNFADLNWKCESPNGVFTVQDTNETTNGAECYQDVAAQAYWGAAPQVDQARGIAQTQKSAFTILNNYRPYVIPDQNVGTDLLHSLYGPSAFWWIDGSWDPPLALTEASHEAVPTLSGGGGAGTVTTTTAFETLTTPAMPASTLTTKVVSTAFTDARPTTSPTALADSNPTMSSASDDEAQPSQTSQPSTAGGSPHQDGPYEQSSGAGGVDTQTQAQAPSSQGGDSTHSGGPQDQPGEAASTTANPHAQMTSIVTETGSNTAVSSQDNIDQAPVVIPGQSSEISWRSHTLTIGGAAWTTDEQVASAGPTGLVVRPASATSETTVIPYTHISSAQTSASTTVPQDTSRSGATDEQHTSMTSSEEASRSGMGQAQQASTTATTGTFSSTGTKSSVPWYAAFVLQLLGVLAF